MTVAWGKLRQSILLIIIAGLTVGTLVTYFFVYVKDKEAYVDKRNFKELSKSAQNIQRKIMVYSTREVTRNFLQYNLNFILTKYFPSSNCLRVKEAFLPYLKTEIEKDKFELSLDSFDLTESKNLSIDKARSGLKISNNTWTFVFHDLLTTCKSKENALVECDIAKDISCIRYRAVSSIPIEKFIRPLLKDDIFSEYVLIDADTSSNNFVLFESALLGAADSLRSMLRSFKDEIMINGIDYRIYAFKFLVEDKPWILIGLQDRESYLNETRSFDRSILYTIILISLILIISLPWIKVILISKNEKLNKADVTMCGVSLLLGCFLWTILLVRLDYEHLFKNYDPDVSDLKYLADEVEKRFEKEITLAYEELNKANESFNHSDEDSLKYSKRSDKTFRYRPSYESFEVISWIDSLGIQQYKWTWGEKPTKKIDVSRRIYFVNALRDVGWPWIDNKKLVLESIRSWNNSGNLAVISKPTQQKGLKVVSISSFLRSAIDCVVPMGYKFCIADQSGNVWFHSNSDRNLNENIFEECNIKYDLNTILYSKGRKSTVIYENRKHDLHIRPLEKFPLFLITMKELSGEQRSKAFVTEITFVLVIIHISLIIVTISIVWLTWRRSLRKYSTPRSSDWLKPDEDKIPAYIKISLLNVVISALLILFAWWLDPTDEIFLYLLTPLYVLPAYYLFLNNQTLGDLFRPLNRGLLVTMLLMITLINFFFFNWIGASPNIIIHQAIILLVIGCWWLFSSNIESAKRLLNSLLNKIKAKHIVRKTSLRTSYSLALTSLFILVAIIPVFEFHRAAFGLERIRYSMELQYNAMSDILNLKNKNNDIYLLPGVEVQRAPYSIPRRVAIPYQRLSKFISPVMDTSATGFIRRDTSFYAYIKDRPWYWSWTDQGRVSWFQDWRNNSFSLRSDLHMYHFPHPLGWVAGLVGLLYLFVFSRYLVTRIFMFDTNRNLVEADMFLVTSESEIGVQQNATTVQLKNHLFIIGLPFSGKQDYVDKLHPPEQNKRVVIDLVNYKYEDSILSVAQNSNSEKIGVIIIDHFEYDFLSKGTNYTKLRLLEELFLSRRKIVVLSTIHPSQLLEQYRRDRETAERWNGIFSHFYNIFFPLHRVHLKKSEIMTQFSINDEKWRMNQHYYEFIERECGHGKFLQNLKPTMYSLVNSADKSKLTLEELSDKVKSLAYTYYASIWSSCSKEERFLIYDLAEDGVINNKNAYSIIQLIYKGVFRQQRTLSLMNRSFRNFVLTYVDPEELLAMRKQTMSHGTWHSVKGPILFVFAIAILFLLYTQRGLADEIMALLGALVAAIPVFLRSFASVDVPARPKGKH